MRWPSPALCAMFRCYKNHLDEDSVKLFFQMDIIPFSFIAKFFTLHVLLVTQITSTDILHVIVTESPFSFFFSFGVSASCFKSFWFSQPLLRSNGPLYPAFTARTCRRMCIGLTVSQ
jgi:hypothetical protein